MYSPKRRFRLFRHPAWASSSAPVVTFDRDTFVWGADGVSTGDFEFLNFAGNTDGTILYGFDSGAPTAVPGRLRKSVDGGLNWTNLIAAVDMSSVDTSADGSKIILTAGTVARFSANSGTTWTFRSTGGTPASGAVSDDGTKYILAYTNTTTGIVTSPTTAVWTKVSSIADTTITDMDCSADNSICYIVGDTTLYKSVDSGVTWQSIALTLPTINSGTDNRYTLLRCSSNGNVVVVASKESVTAPTKNIQVSLDAGVTWTQHTVGFYTSSAIWNVSSSADGSVIAVGMTRGEVYTSTDGGVSFDYQIIPNLGFSATLTSVTHVSRDGLKLFVYSSGKLHTALIQGPVPPPFPNPTPIVAPSRTVSWSATLDNSNYNGLYLASVRGDTTGTLLYFTDTSNGGDLYRSTDGGATIELVFNSLKSDVACSPDGTTVITWTPGSAGIYINTRDMRNRDHWVYALGYVSTVRWALVTPDGSKIIVLGNQTIYISSDSGSTWTVLTSMSLTGTSLASSNTGSILYALGTSLNISTNGGVSWLSRPLSISPNIAIAHGTRVSLIDCSTDGSIVIVGSTATTNNVEVFTYGGRSSKTFTLGTGGIVGVYCSNDGYVMMVTTVDGQVFISDDIGQTFEEQTITSFTNPNGDPPPGFLAKNGLKAMIFTTSPNFFTGTIT